MRSLIGGFDWDSGNWLKCAKHGVSKDEIEHVLTTSRFVVDDPSSIEKRYRTAGPTSAGRYVFVALPSGNATNGRCSDRSAPATCTAKRSTAMKKKWPDLKSDEDAERFVEEADLTEFDFSNMVPAPYEFERKTAALNMRLPQSLLDALKARAQSKGVPFTRYIRMLIEQDVSRPR